MENTWILYRTTNNINGKIYIGVHKLQNTSYSKNYVGSGDNIKAAIKKYGRKNFTRITLAEFSCAEDAYSAEAEIVNEEFVKLTNNYNLSLGGRGGANLTAEMKQKIGNANKGRIASPETRLKLSAVHKGNKYNLGKKHTEAAKIKIGAASKGNQYCVGKTRSQEHIAKLVAANKGNKYNLGRVASEQTRTKISAGNKGKVRTEEHKIKYSESKIGNKHHLGKHHSQESIDKIRSSNKCLSVIIEGEFYISAGLAARVKNVCLQTVLDRVRSKRVKFVDWRFATEEEKLANL
ncbi:hypothetical protein [Pseudanabaena phage PA-SR01]|nr:hypothetical protein [Pseudanabaena phage PA-SR01]